MPATPTTAPILISASKHTLAPGDNVRVSGRFLKNASAVQIGSVALSVLHNSANEIIFVVPSPAPTGTLSVTTAGGKGALGQPFKAALGTGAGSNTPPPPVSPSQAGAAAAVAYDAAYNAAQSAAGAAFNAAGGDAGGAAAHVAAQNAAQAAAMQAAGPGQTATARRAASAAYNDFKTQNLGANNGPNPGINAEGGASGEGLDGGVHSSGMHDLIHTLNQWMQVLPQPLQVLAGAASGILQAAQKMGAQFPAQNGALGGLKSSFEKSMNGASKEAWKKVVGDDSAYGPYQISPLQQKLQGAAEWAGKGVGNFAGKLGLVDSEGAVPPAMAKAIMGGVGLLLIGALNNVKGAFAAGAGASESYTNGLRSGYGALEEAARRHEPHHQPIDEAVRRERAGHRGFCFLIDGRFKPRCGRVGGHGR